MKKKDINSELIGCLIKKPSLIKEADAIIGFKDPLNGPLTDVLRAIVGLNEAKEVIGASSVIRAVTDATDKPTAMWESVVYECMDGVKNPNKAKAYIDEIRNDLIVGKIRDVVNSISFTEGSAHVSGDSLMDQMTDAISTLQASIVSTEDFCMEGDFSDILAEVQTYKETGEIPIIKTGLWELDRLIGGFAKGEYITISGLNGSGKSALATTMMLYQSSPQMNKKTGFISLEMSRADLLKRMYIQIGGINLRDAYAKGMDGKKIEEEVWKAKHKLGQFNIDIVCPKNDNLSSLKNLCRTMVSGGVECIYIDYFQLIKASRTTKIGQKTADLEIVTEEFRRLAKELQVPIVMLSQQAASASKSRGGEVSKDCIEYCTKLAKDVHTTILIAEDKDKIIVDKSRSGPSGEIDVMFNAHGRILYSGRRADTGVVPMESIRTQDA